MDFCMNYLRYYQNQFRIVSKAGRFLLRASCERSQDDSSETSCVKPGWEQACVWGSVHVNTRMLEKSVSLMSLISTSEHSNKTRASTWGLEISRPDYVNLRTRFMQTFIQECGQTGSGPLTWKTSGGIHLWKCESFSLDWWVKLWYFL